MQSQPELKFRNTRSKFYKPKPQESPDRPTDNFAGQTHKANHWKEKGNEAFKNNNLEAAISHYTKAIEIDPSESVYFSNRARCYFIRGDFDKSLKDAQQSIELDEKNIKGQLICGCSLAEVAKKDHKKIDLAVKKLVRALTLCRGQNKEHFQEQVELAIYRAKKMQWYLKYEQQEKQLSNLFEDVRGISQAKSKKFKQLMQQKKQKFDIPDHLCCKITLQIMEDPVVSSAGVTYQREALVQHYQHNGLKDPFTNKPVTKEIYPNQAIKQAIKEFMQNNPWAFEYYKGENYRDIKF